VKLNKQVTRRFSLFVIAILALFAAPVHAQSTDEAHPTAVSAFPVTGTLGSGTYYYSVPATRGRVNMTLEFTPPDSGGSMSVSISGPSCCTSDAYAGGDAGGPTITRREAAFAVGTSQTLLITVYIAVAERQSIRYNLSLTGSVGGAPPTPAPSVCTDLRASSIIGVTRSTVLLSNTIRGSIDNLSATAYRSPADRQWVEIYDTALDPASPALIQRIPFTDVPARGRFQFTARHNVGKVRRVAPVYRIVIVYSPLNSTDDISTNDDCNPANNSAARAVLTPDH
jgi:hypothetical protein